MARPRVYRKDQQCPRCGSNWLPKYGRSRGKQTYRYGQCLYHFTPRTERPHRSEQVKKLAVDLYTEGSSMGAVSRVLEVKSGTVYSWVKKAQWAWELMRVLVAQRAGRRRLKPVRVISFDELWTYVGARRKGKRREAWVWTAIVEEGDGRRWVDFEVGDRSEATFLKLYDRLPEAQRYVSDAYRVYEWLPRNRHVVGKGLEANRNEGLHSVLRDKLNRLHRRTKGYSKSVTMLRDSIALVCLRLGLI